MSQFNVHEWNYKRRLDENSKLDAALGEVPSFLKSHRDFLTNATMSPERFNKAWFALSNSQQAELFRLYAEQLEDDRFNQQ